MMDTNVNEVQNFFVLNAPRISVNYEDGTMAPLGEWDNIVAMVGTMDEAQNIANTIRPVWILDTKRGILTYIP